MIQISSASGTAATILRVAAVQGAPTLGALDENLREIEAAIVSNADADLVVTSEMSVPGFIFRSEQLPEAMSRYDARLVRLAQFGPAVSLGFLEAAETGRPHNSSLLLGDETVVQRKLHLVSYAPWNEHEVFAPGQELASAEVGGAKIATLICNDAWHPVMPWLAAQGGAEVLLIPAASLGRGEDHASARTWDAILTHAARVLQCYVVFVNRVGEEDGHSFWGGSRIVGPTGQVLARAGSGAEILRADLDLEALRLLRRDVPVLREARLHLVEKILTSQAAKDDRV